MKKSPENTEKSPIGSNQRFFRFWKELRKERKEQNKDGIDTRNEVNTVISRKGETRKKLVATVSRWEGACNRAGEPSVTFCGEEEQ